MPTGGRQKMTSTWVGASNGFRAVIVLEAVRPGMWRVRWPDGRLSDMTNLTRAKDAVACFMETEERRRRGRHSPSEGRLCVKTDSWGKGPAADERQCG